MSAAPIVQHFEQLVDLGLALALVAGMEGVRDAVLQVIAQDLLLDAVPVSYTHLTLPTNREV